MAEVVVFHHVQGLTEGVAAIADVFREHGHRVSTPDLFGGRTFSRLEDGVEFVGGLGREVVVNRALEAAAQLGDGAVYCGFSLGTRPAQMLAQSAPGARGALLFHGFYPSDMFAEKWPDGVDLQVHYTVDDEWCDNAVASQLATDVQHAEIHSYEGSRHLFTDSSVADYDAEHADQAIQHALAFLERQDNR